jgi:general stress protein YciG
MDPAKQREIASKGGKAAHQKGTAHEFTPEEAAAAGRKGGRAAHQKGTAHEFTPEEASAAGRKGGHAAHRNRNQDVSPSQGQSTQPAFSNPEVNQSSPNPMICSCPTEGMGSPDDATSQTNMAERQFAEPVASNA